MFDEWHFHLTNASSYVEQTLYLDDGSGVQDPSTSARPARPNSIEVKRNYPNSNAGGEETVYASRQARSPQDGVYRYVETVQGGKQRGARVLFSLCRRESDSRISSGIAFLPAFHSVHGPIVRVEAFEKETRPSVCLCACPML